MKPSILVATTAIVVLTLAALTFDIQLSDAIAQPTTSSPTATADNDANPTLYGVWVEIWDYPPIRNQDNKWTTGPVRKTAMPMWELRAIRDDHPQRYPWATTRAEIGGKQIDLHQPYSVVTTVFRQRMSAAYARPMPFNWVHIHLAPPILPESD